uniref:Protein anoxia up-regulated n=1 Tax=Panagrellus redivivus TaxID=6233 RepID=A0A7E4VLC3_PANRE
MSGLYSTPSYHYISPLSRSGSRSSSTSAIRRSGSYTSSRSGSFTLPSYGYGGGFMAKSLSRSSSSLFGRTLSSSALDRATPFSTVGVQRSTPHYTDRYPYVRYGYGNTDTTVGVGVQTDLTAKHYPSIKDTGTRRWLEGKLNAYNPSLFSRTGTNYPSRVERPITPSRNYVRYMPVDDALDMYKKNCMTVSTLSKYWLSPSTSQSRRDRDLNLTSTLSSASKYSYPSRYENTRPTYYSRVASRLSSSYY